MPSRFRLREKLGLGQSSRDGASLSGLSTALSVQTVSTTTAATSTTTTAPLTTTAASSTRTAATLSQYIVFCFFSSILLKQGWYTHFFKEFCFYQRVAAIPGKAGPRRELRIPYLPSNSYGWKHPHESQRLWPELEPQFQLAKMCRTGGEVVKNSQPVPQKYCNSCTK